MGFARQMRGNRRADAVAAAAAAVDSDASNAAPVELGIVIVSAADVIRRRTATPTDAQRIGRRYDDVDVWLIELVVASEEGDLSGRGTTR